MLGPAILQHEAGGHCKGRRIMLRRNACQDNLCCLPCSERSMPSNPSSAPSSTTALPVATGFDFEPLPTGDVLIEFHGDDEGVKINSQIIARECFFRLPVVACALLIAAERGEEAARKFLKKMSKLDFTNNSKKENC